MDPNPVPSHLGVIDLDTPAPSKNGSPPSNGSLQNGFASPPIIKELNDLSIPDSTPEEITGRRSFLPTGLCYDDRMKLHANADWSASPHHPEDPRRIEAIMKAFRDAGLVYTGTASELIKLLEVSPTRWMWRIQAREASEAEVCTAHTAAHLQWARDLSTMTSEELRKLARELDMGRKSLYVGTLTYYAALISAGGAIETCKNVVEGKVKNAIAVIRPPGHHAEHNEPMGFCIFNNVPIAVKVCMADYQETCRKVLILDWDVHHGNGIQNIFYDDPNVLYISIHVYENGTFYPGQPDDPGIPDGGPENCGVGAGLGRNINIGWHTQGVGDGEYMAAFQRIVMPIAREFDPDLVVISAGFDAAAGDELGGCYVTPECYSHMTHMLMSLAGGKVAVCLEGGYNLTAISRSALAVAKTLMGEPPERMIIPQITNGAAMALHEVRLLQSRYWQCMRPGAVPVEVQEGLGGVRLHDAIRSYQRRILTLRYNMVSLRVQRDKTSPSFEDQVLVTPGIYAAKKILLIIHDAPEVIAQPDPIDNRVFSHNAWVNDGVLPYIKWAVSSGYAVMDVNIPIYITDPQSKNSYISPLPQSSAADTPSIENQTKDLLCYLWDNYITGYACNSLVVMGVGDAYLGAKQLLISRDSRPLIPCILSFVTGTLRPVKSETDPHLSPWYKSHSRIYVSPEHSCWTDPESAKKVRKNRFGGVRASEVAGLNAMMATYLNEGTEWVDEMVRMRYAELGMGEAGEGGDETESEGRE
ncbi:hypothetical protein OIDMADRAFT_43096 [Oidiodendron maius Zn]|uniref:Histone deacetylase n=1 Tax=Oidiodendron maius (strain Zn) TaxID=913774 RepID=A0A0C3DAR9_OIDMZ|nr:hypothetical protein OIDMADRAFT_43096 [Oidiodendron maius Zn]